MNSGPTASPRAPRGAVFGPLGRGLRARGPDPSPVAPKHLETRMLGPQPGDRRPHLGQGAKAGLAFPGPCSNQVAVRLQEGLRRLLKLPVPPPPASFYPESAAPSVASSSSLKRGLGSRTVSLAWFLKLDVPKIGRRSRGWGMQKLAGPRAAAEALWGPPASKLRGSSEGANLAPRPSGKSGPLRLSPGG